MEAWGREAGGLLARGFLRSVKMPPWKAMCRHVHPTAPRRVSDRSVDSSAPWGENQQGGGNPVSVFSVPSVWFESFTRGTYSNIVCVIKASFKEAVPTGKMPSHGHCVADLRSELGRIVGPLYTQGV